MLSSITIITDPSTKIEVLQETSVYAPKGYVYILPEKESLITMARSIHQAEREKNEWIRKYDNLLKGLNFWKDKALSK